MVGWRGRVVVADGEEGEEEINPYKTLDLPQTATPDQIKSAYRKAALKNHPDKAPSPAEQPAYKEKFQQIAFAYAILSDPIRRKRYDQTGSTSESIVDSQDFNWSDFYAEQFRDVVSEESIEAFRVKYKGSQEEKDDLLAAYQEFEGDMDAVYETVMLSDVVEDDERFRGIIDEGIEEGLVEKYDKYTKEGKKTKRNRVKNAKKEAEEAEELAKELGVHEKLKKGGKGKGKGGEDALAALIRGNQAKRGDMFDHLVEKYGGGGKEKKTKKGGKRKTEEEEPDIDDEEFERLQREMMKKKATKKRKA
ncbi:DnaJ domain-containing protein [Podospora fimiseda]|uniref:DnaJ domain-containing protein n=1 Tax=Podospora fimiseda TaxID=252190 RepID=A0AAN7H587_9PEZI|nr:DnaJ domain-containing protein [Podospora fimiseda]